MITIKINCEYLEGVDGCTNTEVRKSFFGIGRRKCVELCSHDLCYFKREIKKDKTTTTIGKTYDGK
jgi:hypothetical protein